MLCSTAFSLSLFHPDSTPQAKKTTTPSVQNGEGRRPICPETRLRLRMSRVRRESPTSWQVVKSQSTALRTAVVAPHDVVWIQRCSSRLRKPHACHGHSWLRSVTLQNAGIRASYRDSHIHSPSNMRSRRYSRRDVKRRLSVSMNLNRPSRVL